MTIDRPTDAVDPAHYRTGSKEAIDVIMEMMTMEMFIGFCRGNALKYTIRAGYKGDKDANLAKAAWYLQMEDHRMGEAIDPREEKDASYLFIAEAMCNTMQEE